MASVAKREWTHKGETKTAWVVRYTDQGGKRRMKTFEKKKDADKYRNKVETEVERGEHVPDRETATVSQALDLWLDHCEGRVRVKDHLRPRTLRHYRSWVENHIRPSLGGLKLTSLTIHLLQKWVDDQAFDRERPRSHDTLMNSALCLRMMLRHAHRHNLVGRNVLVDHELRIPGKKGERLEIPSKDDVRRFLEWSGEVTGPGGVAPYLRPMIFTAVFAGLRQGELRALTWENVDFDAKIIRVRQSADNFGLITEPKSRASIRDVPLAPVLSIELKKHKLACGRSKSPLVFHTRSGGVIDPGGVHQAWQRLQHRAANGGRGQTACPLGRFTFHSLRHVCASLLIETGLPPKRVQAIMGHSSIQMTFDRYGHLFEDGDAVTVAMGKIGASLTA
jgi:integrase